MSAADPKKLTPKQQRFVEEYLVDGNGKQAAIRAGYAAKDAETQASRLLSRNVKVQAAVAKGQVKVSAKLDVTKDRVLSELAAIAFSDPAGLYGSDGNLLAIKDMPEHVRRAIASVKVNRTATRKAKPGAEGEEPTVETQTEEHTVEIRHWPKVAALEDLCKHLGLFAAEKHEHTGADGKPIELAVSLNLKALDDGQLDQFAELLGRTLAGTKGDGPAAGRD